MNTTTSQRLLEQELDAAIRSTQDVRENSMCSPVVEPIEEFPPLSWSIGALAVALVAVVAYAAAVVPA